MLDDIWARGPTESARLAVQHGDRRLRSVATLAEEPYTPGVVDPDIRSSYGEYLILGTEGSPKCYEHLRKMLLAREYAREYNLAVVSLFEESAP